MCFEEFLSGPSAGQRHVEACREFELWVEDTKVRRNSNAKLQPSTLSISSHTALALNRLNWTSASPRRRRRRMERVDSISLLFLCLYFCLLRSHRHECFRERTHVGDIKQFSSHLCIKTSRWRAWRLSVGVGASAQVSNAYVHLSAGKNRMVWPFTVRL